MSLSVEKLENSMAKLTIEVSAEEFGKAVTQAYNKEKGKFAVPGFRKGRVPQAYIEKMYGPSVFYEEAANNLINKYYIEEIEKSDLDIVSRPEIDVTQIEKGKEFIFTAEVAIKPEIKLGDYKNIEIEKVDENVSDDEIMAEILKVQKENARAISVSDRAAKLEDEVIINYEGFVEEVPFDGGKGDEYKLKLGSGTFIQGFEEQIVGKMTGDKFDVNVTFPENYQSEELSGKPALFKVELLEIKEMELPELDDEFASEISEFETLEEYKEDLKEKLTDKKKTQVLQEKQSKIVEKLASISEIDIPEPMIKYNQEKMIEDFSQRLSYQGLQLDQYLKITNMTKDKFMDQVKPDAIAKIKSSLVLEAVVVAENIQATEEEVDTELENMSKTYQMEVDKLKELIGDKEKETLKMDIAIKKALDFLVLNCKEA